MTGLTIEVKDEMLAIFTGQALTVGLFDGEDEIVDVRYERLPVVFGPPQGEGLRYIENENEITFDDMGQDHTVDYWGVFDASGQLLARERLTFLDGRGPALPGENRAFFKAGTLSIGIP